MTSSFTHMAQALTRPVWPFRSTAAAAEPAATSRTESIRQLLRQGGPMRAQRIATELDLPQTALVGALLKADLARGRVRLCNGIYEWNHDHDDALARELSAAARLLRRHGYRVQEPR